MAVWRSDWAEQTQLVRIKTNVKSFDFTSYTNCSDQRKLIKLIPVKINNIIILDFEIVLFLYPRKRIIKEKIAIRINTMSFISKAILSFLPKKRKYDNKSNNGTKFNLFFIGLIFI